MIVIVTDLDLLRSRREHSPWAVAVWIACAAFGWAGVWIVWQGIQGWIR